MSLDEAEDYLDIISQPMDFQTMLGKLSQGSYRHPQGFLEDVKLVFSNAEEYNQQGSTVLSCMAKTEETFTMLLQRLLPGHSYVRRRSRKRVTQAPPTSEEDEEEEATPPSKKKVQNGRSTREKRARNRGEESEEEEEEQDEEDAGRRRSRRSTATSGKKNYREQDSDGERDTRQRHSKRLKR